jgi:hypothetical protein
MTSSEELARDLHEAIRQRQQVLRLAESSGYVGVRT